MACFCICVALDERCLLRGRRGGMSLAKAPGMKRAPRHFDFRPPLGLSGVVAALAATACGHSGSEAGASNATRSSVADVVGVTHQPSTRQDVAEPAVHADDARSVALAHCQQQQRCGFVGPGQRYSSTEDCLARVGQTQASILNDFSCPTGSDPVEMRGCLEDVRTMDCAQPFGEVRTLGHCSTPRLCPSAVAQGGGSSNKTGIEAR